MQFFAERTAKKLATEKTFFITGCVTGLYLGKLPSVFLKTLNVLCVQLTTLVTFE